MNGRQALVRRLAFAGDSRNREGRARQAATAARPSLSCPSQHGGLYPQVYTVTQVPTGTVLGTATFVVSHEIELSATGLKIDDNAAVTLTASTGVLTSPIASFSASCSAPCNTDDGAGFTLETFTRGETEDAFFSYSDDPKRQRGPVRHQLHVHRAAAAEHRAGGPDRGVVDAGGPVPLR